ncbi:hypothetical protein PDESU_03837 [Pontiella desulfatans]|uniref:Carrier domain-containing protein n=1 Tax=Pontiella desulfatans TaxID=2750659 RepID=A0A6C2U5R7_PONDE|nr:hypothetical protein [Pontiella desulfatans]VGO15255.1 hypothetical protein PDESU_03837 [Pontiella desulfatans]
MGLDGVELIMETENVFGIRIEDEEAEVCLHPRDVIELVWSKVSHADKAVCPSQRAFCISRRALVDVFGIAEEQYSEDARFVEDYGV